MKAKKATLILILLGILVGCTGEISKAGDPYYDETTPVIDLPDSDVDIVDYLFDNGFELVWEDEFNEDRLDLSCWNYEIGNGTDGWGNWEAQYYDCSEDEVSLSDGYLVIRAHNDGTGWKSGRIKTQRRFHFKYGYIEAKVLLPKGTGMWPAFWLLGCDPEDGSISWPHTGEFDIMEYSPGTQGDKVFATLHTGSNNGGNGYPLGEIQIDDEYLAEEHRFGLLWTKDGLSAYYDGHLIGSKERPGADVEEWPFNKYEAFILLNLAVGGNLGGTVPADASEYIYKVDYVRLYQADENGYIRQIPT